MNRRIAVLIGIVGTAAAVAARELRRRAAPPALQPSASRTEPSPVTQTDIRVTDELPAATPVDAMVIPAVQPPLTTAPVAEDAEIIPAITTDAAPLPFDAAAPTAQATIVDLDGDGIPDIIDPSIVVQVEVADELVEDDLEPFDVQNAARDAARDAAQDDERTVELHDLDNPLPFTAAAVAESQPLNAEDDTLLYMLDERDAPAEATQAPTAEADPLSLFGDVGDTAAALDNFDATVLDETDDDAQTLNIETEHVSEIVEDTTAADQFDLATFDTEDDQETETLTDTPDPLSFLIDDTDTRTADQFDFATLDEDTSEDTDSFYADDNTLPPLLDEDEDLASLEPFDDSVFDTPADEEGAPEPPTVPATFPESVLVDTTFTAEVVRLDDADEMYVRHENGEIVHIRLWGVIAPKAGEPHYDEAKSFTEVLIAGRTLAIRARAAFRQGYRLVAWVTAGDISLNMALVENGYARWYAELFPGEIQIAEAEARARDEKLGMWAPPHRPQP